MPDIEVFIYNHGNVTSAPGNLKVFFRCWSAQGLFRGLRRGDTLTPLRRYGNCKSGRLQVSGVEMNVIRPRSFPGDFQAHRIRQIVQSIFVLPPNLLPQTRFGNGDT